MYSIFMYAWFILSAVGENEEAVKEFEAQKEEDHANNLDLCNINLDLLANKVAKILLEKITDDGKLFL